MFFFRGGGRGRRVDAEIFFRPPPKIAPNVIRRRGIYYSVATILEHFHRGGHEPEV